MTDYDQLVAACRQRPAPRFPHAPPLRTAAPPPAPPPAPPERRITQADIDAAVAALRKEKQ